MSPDLAVPETAPRDRLGAAAQVAWIDRFVETDGPAQGARRLRLVAGGGIEVDVHPDRALDLGRVSVDGRQLAWISPTGITAPGLADPSGDGWVKTFGGGLLSTIGLDGFGPSGEEDGLLLGTHGRIHAVPAVVTVAGELDGALVVRGTVRQATAFGEHLRLNREIQMPLGGRSITVVDTVENEGAAPAEWMLLYHVNLGWPLLDEGAVIDAGVREVISRDEDAAAGLADWNLIGPPEAEAREQVFQGVVEGDEGVVSLVNERRGLALDLRFSSETLPWLNVWKLLRSRNYVLGIEPTNTPALGGRAAARAAGILPRLEPGESRRMTLELSFR